MMTETEHYRLELVPKWTRKKLEFETVSCCHCDGKGYVPEEDFSLSYRNCRWCFGSGTKQIPKKLPPPPDIDMDFVSFMRKAFQEYLEKSQ